MTALGTFTTLQQSGVNFTNLLKSDEETDEEKSMTVHAPKTTSDSAIKIKQQPKQLFGSIKSIQVYSIYVLGFIWCFLP